MKPVLKENALFIDTDTILNKRELQRLSKQGIKRIVTLTAGLDHVDLKSAQKLGFRVENVPEINFRSTSEYALAALFYHARQYPHHNAVGTELHDKNVAILGYGRVGKRIGMVLKALGMHIHPFDLPHSASYLKKILSKADFVFLCMPLTTKTRQFIDYPRLQNCKKGAVVFNFAREGLVDNDAMCLALQEKKVSAYYVDERLPHKPFVCTPHIAWRTKEVIQRKAEHLNGKKM